MTEAAGVSCPVCGSPKNHPCTTLIVGGTEYHAGRYQKARAYETTVLRLERERQTAVREAEKTRARHKVTPIGTNDLDGYTLAVRCASCNAKPGNECSWQRATRIRFHTTRTKRGTAAMKRSTDINED
ncbi:zinc finger domain-containing protein [Nocardiopsis dassonvillei]|uniref:zinc finger domain-containing protein n=1 Tax=Nocardiopsis dassonvillei TaxID=2014 RepID=UPI003FD8A182